MVQMLSRRFQKQAFRVTRGAALCEFHETERATLVLATELADEHEVLYDTNELLQLTEACAPLRYRTSSSCNLAICSRIIFASAQSSVGPAPWF